MKQNLPFPGLPARPPVFPQTCHRGPSPIVLPRSRTRLRAAMQVKGLWMAVLQQQRTESRPFWTHVTKDRSKGTGSLTAKSWNRGPLSPSTCLLHFPVLLASLGLRAETGSPPVVAGWPLTIANLPGRRVDTLREGKSYSLPAFTCQG